MSGTAFDIFADAAAEVPDRDYLVVPPSAAKDYAPEGVTLTYAQGLARIEAWRAAYAAAGYGHGHRVALLLENRPEFFDHWLALNALGVSVVPVNPHYRSEELTYLLDHSDAVLAVSLPERIGDLEAAAATLGRPLPVIAPDAPPPAAVTQAPLTGAPDDATECALMYTSGTTGKPQGCILSNEYYAMLGGWYANQGGLCPIETGGERLLTPLPLFHMNPMACSFIGMLLTRNTTIQL
ncbi:MAG: AMP-binding protein, partial [Bauldia litoralis]